MCPHFQIVAQVWPFLGQYMEKLLAETVAPAVRGSNPHLQTFTFTRVELGEKVLLEELRPGGGAAQKTLRYASLPSWLSQGLLSL